MMSAYMIEPPKVTGLSPKEGEPGTKITIRGENLGTSQNDVIGLTICGVDCLTYAEWHSPSKIIARCGPVKVSQYGNVIVTTKSGGRGSCTVQFKVLVKCIGPLDESAIWVEETYYKKKRPTSPLPFYPEDPLRLSDEASVERFPVEEIQELYPDGSGNILEENFEPTWYLLENHHGARFEDLKTGLAYLQRKVSTHDEAPLSFMKSNLSSYMSCLEALAELKVAVDKDLSESEGSLADRAEQAMQKSREEAFNLFEEMLARKEKADSTRNALSVLQRFRFLFNLPSSIEKNIRKGDYEIVINDYSRAKSLFQDTEVTIFKRVYKEVEQRIEQFRELLAEKLKEMPSTVAEQKRLIKFLVNLETPSDPAWQCVLHNKTWLMNVLNKTKEKHQALVNSNNSNDLKKLPQDIPQIVKFIIEITEQFTEHFPNLWKLGQAYLSGELHVREVSEPLDKFALPKTIQFKNMMMEVTYKFSHLIRMALLPSSLHALSVQQIQALGSWPKSESITPWLPYCLRNIRNSYSSLLKLDLPDDVLNTLQQLIFDLKVHAMKTLFMQASEDIQHLDERENWAIEIDDENGGITKLPLLFENRVMEILQLVRETVLQTGPRETDIFTQINVQATIKQSSQSLLQAFAVALDKMAQSIKISIKDRSLLKNKDVSTRSSSGSQSMFLDDDSDSLSDDAKCLVILSNCNFTVKCVIPRLQDSFVKYEYPDMQLVIRSSVTRFQDLSSKLFDFYVEHKCDPIVGAIEQRMYASTMILENENQLTGVSVYIKQIIMDMIEVHAEVFAISPPFVNKVLTKVVESIIEELARLYECVDNYEGNENIQASLNLLALEEIMSAYKTTNTNKHFMTCKNKLKPLIGQKEKELVTELLKAFKNQIRLQLLCFKEEPITV